MQYCVLQDTIKITVKFRTEPNQTSFCERYELWNKTGSLHKKRLFMIYSLPQIVRIYQCISKNMFFSGK